MLEPSNPTPNPTSTPTPTPYPSCSPPHGIDAPLRLASTLTRSLEVDPYGPLTPTRTSRARDSRALTLGGCFSTVFFLVPSPNPNPTLTLTLTDLGRLPPHGLHRLHLGASLQHGRLLDLQPLLFGQVVRDDDEDPRNEEHRSDRLGQQHLDSRSSLGAHHLERVVYYLEDWRSLVKHPNKRRWLPGSGEQRC